MTRENTHARAGRLLTEGRLIVEAAGPRYFAATVRGSGDIHHVSYGRGGWECTCPARSRCAHLVACWLIAAPASRPSPASEGDTA